MTELIGTLLIFTAIIFGCIFLFGWEFTLKEKIQGIFLFEIFIWLIGIGGYLINNGC